MKHIQQYTEQNTFQKFVKTSKRDGVEDYIDKSSKRNGYSKQREFKRDMWSSQNET